MEVITIEKSAFQKLENMFSEVCAVAKTLKEENKQLKSKKLITSHDVAAMTGYDEKTIRTKKEEIGFFSVGGKVMFRPEDVDNWINNNYIKPRTKRK